MIRAEGLTKRFGALTAVEDVSFSVGRGEIVGFLGPNGAGKSTTMRVLTGFAPATTGRAEVAGYEVHTHPLEVKRRVGYLPERVPLYDEMITRAYLRYVATIKGVPRRMRRDEVDRVMARCAIEEMAGRMLGNLSKGYRQRVGIAQALIGNPPVLILDEPTVGLDPRQIAEVRQFISSLAPDHTVLLSTHLLPEVAIICQRAIIINNARVAAELEVGDDPRALEDTFMRVVAPGAAAMAGAAQEAGNA
ncbi:MAG: ABC transporter ATP-binding protein [Candidatus Hydrogenedentota bacterium]